MEIDIYDDDYSSFVKEIEKKRLKSLSRVKRKRIAVLLWGPSACHNTEISKLRENIRQLLVDKGHVADLGEKLCCNESEFSILTQQASQAEAYDLIFSLPDSHGSIAEIHDFARIPHISHKITTFLNSELNDGYANKSLIELQSYQSCKISFYNTECFPECIITEVLQTVARLQEIYYIYGRRG